MLIQIENFFGAEKYAEDSIGEDEICIIILI
jgi:hypothetical protein